MGSGKVLSSVLVGAAEGAILGILFAQDKGSETRRKIAEKGSEFADSLKDKFSEYAYVISDNYNAAKQKFTGLASEGKDMGKDLVNQAKDKVTN